MVVWPGTIEEGKRLSVAVLFFSLFFFFLFFTFFQISRAQREEMLKVQIKIR